MLKVLKNLKESWLSVIAIVLLLIVQAAGDLTLPDYTSKIVNIGDVLIIRGKGKFIVGADLGENKKGKRIVEIKKYK